MDKNTMDNVKTKMIQALSLIKEAFDQSVPLLKTGQKNDIVILWETFIREALDYIKQKSKESGSNLINSISISKIWFR